MTDDITILTREDLPADGEYSIGMRTYYTAEVALHYGEQQCYAGNRLTAPFHGIETRDSVFFDGEYFRTITFPIKTKY